MKLGLDWLVVQGNRIFAYGWLFDEDVKIRHLQLRVLLDDGTEVFLPAYYGKKRSDVYDAYPDNLYTLFSGWMIYAAWDGSAAIVLALVGRLENGNSYECLLPFNTSVDSAAANALTRSTHGMLRARRLLAKLLVVGGDPLGWYRSFAIARISPAVVFVRNMLVEARVDRCVLVIDHDMGGGANHYRREWITQLLVSRPFVIVLTFEIQTLRYAFDIITVDGSKRHILGFDEPATSLAESGLIEEVMYNDAVSFPRPEDVPRWLVAFKKVPGTTLTVAIHDYLSVCPSQFLLNDRGRFCGVPDVSECRRCLVANENEFVGLFTSRLMPQWRIGWFAALAAADQILCFSSSSRTLLCRAYPSLDRTRITIKAHTITAFDRQPVISVAAPLHIGVVGAIGIHKGAGVIQALTAEIVRRGLHLKITIFGSLDLACDPEVIEITGVYRHSDLPSLIESTGANVFLMPSICPETFSYVTHELMSLNLPIVSFDFGAPAERLVNYRLGRVVPWVTSAKLLDALIQFHSDLFNSVDQKSV
jgi:glycosyltransferase involved in cell wall biosynthesis